MISVTKLLFARNFYGDSLRYTHSARQMRNGTAEGIGPVVVWNSTRTCNLRCRHCYMDSIYQAAAFSKLALPFQENVRLKIKILLDGIKND